MIIKVEGKAKARLLSGKVVTIDSDNLDFASSWTEEREMGAATGHIATVDLEDGASLQWEVVEYPVGAWNDISVHGDKAELLTDFKIYFEHTPDD